MKSAKIITVMLIFACALGAGHAIGEPGRQVQREPSITGQQENKVSNKLVENSLDSKPPRSKTDSKAEDTSRFPNETMQKYKAPADGEGEKK